MSEHSFDQETLLQRNKSVIEKQFAINIFCKAYIEFPPIDTYNILLLEDGRKNKADFTSPSSFDCGRSIFQGHEVEDVEQTSSCLLSSL